MALTIDKVVQIVLKYKPMNVHLECLGATASIYQPIVTFSPNGKYADFESPDHLNRINARGLLDGDSVDIELSATCEAIVMHGKDKSIYYLNSLALSWDAATWASIKEELK